MTEAVYASSLAKARIRVFHGGNIGGDVKTREGVVDGGISAKKKNEHVFVGALR